MAPKPETKLRGVVDIGSNSVRIKIFSKTADCRFETVIEESVACGLGEKSSARAAKNLEQTGERWRDLAKEYNLDLKATFADAAAALKQIPFNANRAGELSASAAHTALVTLALFGQLASSHDISIKRLFAVATAAVRNAPEKQRSAFLAQAGRLLNGIDVSLLSGEEEARLTGVGVINAFPARPAGRRDRVADMGGGSLELIELHGAHIDATQSLDAGALLLPATRHAYDKRIRPMLKKAAQHTKPVDCLYLSGGYFRAWCKIMDEARIVDLQARYGDNLFSASALTDNERQARKSALHGAEFSRGEFSGLLNRLVNELNDNPRRFFERYKVDPRREAALLRTGWVIQQLIESTRPAAVALTTHGLREGVLYDHYARKNTGAGPAAASG